MVCRDRVAEVGTEREPGSNSVYFIDHGKDLGFSLKYVIKLLEG